MSDDIQLVSDFAVCDAGIRALITSSQPEFISRIGGSDADVVAEYHHMTKTVGLQVALELIQEKFGIVKLFNGYYDRSDDPNNIARFCQLMTQGYQSCEQLMVVGSPWLTEFLPDTINPSFHVDTTEVRPILRGFFADIGAAQKPAIFYPYSYVERVLHGRYTLFNAFAETLPGKRVLAVTPFAESINANWERRHDFFKNYRYPEFELSTYNTPVTYHGLPPEFYPDHDWFATLERMKHEISALDFDIALLSCGSYAVPLGLHIKNVMQKKAIYAGGCLQLYFGITGRRYDNPFFSEQINPEAFILPVERDKYLKHVVVKENSAKDAFGAYF